MVLTILSFGQVIENTTLSPVLFNVAVKSIVFSSVVDPLLLFTIDTDVLSPSFGL